MVAHVFLRPPTQSEKKNLVSNSNSLIIATSSVYRCFNGISCTLYDPTPIKSRVNSMFFDWVINFGEKEINNKCVADLLTINNQSFWHYHKYRAYFHVREQVYEVDIAAQLASQYKEVYLYSLLPDLAKDTLPNNVTLITHTNNVKGSKAHSVLFRYAAFVVWRSVRALFKTKPKNKHIIIDKGIKQYSLNTQDLSISKSNIYLNNVFNAANGNFCVVTDTDIPSLEKGGFYAKNHPSPKINSNAKLFFGEYLLLKALLLPKTWHRVKRIDKQIRASINTLCGCVSHPYDRLITNHLLQYAYSNKAYILKNIAWELFLKSNPVKSISSIDENSPMVLSIFDAAKAQGIPRIAIQHGTIHLQHPAYIHTKNDANRGVFPTLTLAWGSAWEQLLTTKANYPSSMVRVAGQQRTDIIPILEANKAKVEQIIGFKHPHPVMFASQPQQDESLRKRAAEDVFTAAKANPSILMVIKLHPRESNDIGYYQAIAKQIGCTNYIITIKTDLYALLSYCKVVVTCFSTVGTEAIYFKKPLVILDHLNADVLGLVKEQLAIQATNSLELSQAIASFVDERIGIDTNTYNHYIKQYAYQIDGLAGQRVICAIESTC